MHKYEKYKGIFPAFYACYDDFCEISANRIKEYAKYLAAKGIKGLYVGGITGECNYQTIKERETVLENVVQAAGERVTIIVNVTANATKDSVRLALHAKACGASAVCASVPFDLSKNKDASNIYLSEIINCTSLDFILHGQAEDFHSTKLTSVIGLYSSISCPLDFLAFKDYKNDSCVLFCGADEQFTASRMLYANSSIGETFGIMPELFLSVNTCLDKGDYKKAAIIQDEINKILLKIKSARCSISLYKEILHCQGINVGIARAPALPLNEEEKNLAKQITDMISRSIAKTR